jgi:tetratricopeptide (TPR) repeat protein
MSRGNVDQAVTALLKAISLDPRHAQYSLNLAQLYLMQRKYDDAIKLLQQVANSGQLPFNEVAAQQLSNAQSMKEMASSGHEIDVGLEEGTVPNAEPERPGTAIAPPPPSGPVTFLKGKLQSVDCSASPGAEIIVISAAKTWKFHVRNVQHAILIGEDSFSCGWTNRKVAVNFRQTGTAMGEVVSLELQ